MDKVLEIFNKAVLKHVLVLDVANKLLLSLFFRTLGIFTQTAIDMRMLDIDR